MPATKTPLKSAYTRVYLAEHRVRPDEQMTYHHGLRAMALSQALGDSERIEQPDPDNFGKFIEIGEVEGAEERPTFGLQGRFPATTLSPLKRIATIRCAIDVHIVIGTCTDPKIHDQSEKIIIIENARFTNWETDELGAMASDDNSPVNESVEISAEKAYEVVPVAYGTKAGSVISNEVVGIAICDNISCGSCGDPSDGCQKIYAVTVAAGGSPATFPDIVFSLDKGVTWYAHDVDSVSSQPAVDIFCIGAYVVVLTNDDATPINYVLKEDLNAIEDPSFTAVTTGFVAGKGPKAAWSLGGAAFIVGSGGYIYFTENPLDGVTVLDAGALTTATWNDVHAISEEVALAVGNNGAIAYTLNGTNWSLAAVSPVGFPTNLTACWMLSDKIWLVGSSAGRLYMTTDSGNSWTEKSFPGSGAGSVQDLFFSTASVGWLSHATATPRGRILRSTTGGNSWYLTPEKTGTLPNTDRINALAGCASDPNFIVGGGLADDGTDGVILQGQGS